MKTYFLFITVFYAFNANAQLAGTFNAAFSQDGWDDTFFGGNQGLAFPITKTIIQPESKNMVFVNPNNKNKMSVHYYAEQNRMILKGKLNRVYTRIE